MCVYVICSFQCMAIINHICKITPNGRVSKIITSCEINTHYHISKKRIGELFDFIKCLCFVIISSTALNNKNITAFTSIIALAGNYFPFFGLKSNRSKNFIGFILIGAFLDIITSISMLFAYFVSIHYGKHKSIATASAMCVGIAKTIIHIALVTHVNYLETIYFIFYGILGICRNKKTLSYMYNYTMEKHKKTQQNEKIRKMLELQRQYKGKNRNRKYSEKVDIIAKKKTERTIKMKQVKKQDMLEIANKARNEYRNSNKAKQQITYDIVSKEY